MNFKSFRNKDTGIVSMYPSHYETHPIYKDLLEPVSEANDEEFEEDKVVVDETHELPVEQRTAKRQTRKAAKADTDETMDKE